MHRRYRPNRKNTNYTIPLVAVCIIATALLLWGIWAKGEDVLRYFKGEDRIIHDNREANENLSRLLADLSGDKAQLLELAAASKVRLGWIDNETTRRQFRWFLMERLLDKGLWEEAVEVLPEVEELANSQDLERLAQCALDHKNYGLQLRLDQRLQELAMGRPEETELLLRSIRRTAETCIKMHNTDEAVKVISRLDERQVLAQLSTPQLAAQAADLQMLRADVSGAKDLVLQLVRNILEKAQWPPCQATSRLMLEEVSTALQDNPILSQAALKEIETKLMHCRDALLDYADREHKLPQCYLILGELRMRMGNYEGCAQALTLADAFAEGYGQSNLEWQLQVSRMRAKANMARGAKVEALEDCRFLAEHEKAPDSLMMALTYLSANVTGTEREKVLDRLWREMQSQPRTTKAEKIERARIANEIFKLNAESGTRELALRWGTERLKATQDAYPDLSDGKVLRASLELALLLRKKEEGDRQARTRLLSIVKTIDDMDESMRKKLTAADKDLYATAVKEYVRTCSLMGDKELGRDFLRKKLGSRENMPERRR